MIINKYDIEIVKEKLYNEVSRYILPDGYYFESYGTNYGQVVFGMDDLTNNYIIRKVDEKD